LEQPVTEGWITLKQIFEKYDAGQRLEYLIQDRDMWQAIANMVKLWVL